MKVAVNQATGYAGVQVSAGPCLALFFSGRTRKFRKQDPTHAIRYSFYYPKKHTKNRRAFSKNAAIRFYIYVDYSFILR